MPADILLLIEVADSSLRYDRDVKIRLYAKAGIAQAWLVDVNAWTLRRFLGPDRTGYAESERIDDLTAVPVLGLGSIGLDVSRFM